MSQTIEKPAIDGEVILPWREWSAPRFHEISLGDLRVTCEDDKLVLKDLSANDVIGEASDATLWTISDEVDMPFNFISKLPKSMRVDIFNNRIEAARDREVMLVVDPSDELPQVSSFIRRNLGILSYQETCEIAYETLGLTLPEEPTVDHAFVGARGMTLRLLTPLEMPVTRKVGDTLGMGIEINQFYGTTTDVSLFMRRLICLNGMTRDAQTFQWRRAAESTPEFQRMWLRESIVNSMSNYEQTVERAQMMAVTRLEGDPREALMARARAAGIPARHHESLWTAFQAEPEPTEWGIANAMTRLATHTALPGQLNRRMRAIAGEWTGAFDLCTARLPRPVAEHIGAEIVG